MKKVYLFLTVLTLSFGLRAQSFDIRLIDANGVDVTNGTYAVPSLHGGANEYDDIKFKIKNNGSQQVDLRIRRMNVQQPTGYENTICIAGFCYSAATDETTQEFLLPAGATDSSFYGTFTNKQGTSGDLCVTYKIFNMENENEFVTVRAYYGTCLTASVTENAAEAISLSAYPNPASGSVLIKYNLATDGQLLITDITGKTLKNIRLNGGSQATQVDISDLRAGVYVYSVQTGSRRIISKKLVVR